MSNPDSTEWSDFNKFDFTAPSFLKPEYTMINIHVGSGSVIGESNIEQFLNFYGLFCFDRFCLFFCILYFAIFCVEIGRASCRERV